MPTMQLGLHPNLLGALRTPPRAPANMPGLMDPGRLIRMGVTNPTPLGNPPPRGSGPGFPGLDELHPTILQNIAGGGTGASTGPVNPYMGGTSVGAYGTPAPFNPLLAQTIYGLHGGLQGGGGAAAMGGAGAPPGSFGLTPAPQRPRGINPYRS